MKKGNKRGLTEFDPRNVLIAPSILAADFSRLGEEIKSVEEAGAEVLHVDVMDGHFVPNISIGPPVVQAIRKTTDLPFDVHLMIEHPEDFIVPFAEAGADHLTVHVEAACDAGDLIDLIRETGCSAGLVLKPATSVAAVEPWLDRIDLVLVMSVEPGFGGQSFMPKSLNKLTQLRRMIDRIGRNIQLEVDGGIDERTAPEALAAGANMLVAGTSVFRHPEGCGVAIKRLRGTD